MIVFHVEQEGQPFVVDDTGSGFCAVAASQIVIPFAEQHIVREAGA